jgi:hypothetical protein
VEPEAVSGDQAAEAVPVKEEAAGSGRQFWDGLLKEEHQQAEALALAAMGKVCLPLVAAITVKTMLAI